jgi:hypothetical protein
MFSNPKIRKDDKFIVIEEFKANCLTYFKGPYTFGFECMIPKDTILIAPCDSGIFSLGFDCVPENPHEFHKFIPEEQINDSKYQCFSIVLRYSDIGKLVNKIS